MARVCPFTGMRFENQVIAHPYRIETISFSAPRSFTAVSNRQMSTEMGQQETEFEFCRHDVVQCR